MNKKNTLLLAAFICLGVLPSYAYQISIKIKGGSNTKYLLGYYYGDKQYIRDSAVADATGKAVFKGKDKLDGGIYIIASSDRKLLFDFVVTEQEFALETDTADYIENMKVKGSPENEVFFEYSRFANNRGRKGIEIEKKYKEAKTANDTAAMRVHRESLKALENEMNAYRKNVGAKYPGFMISKIFSMMKEIDIPETPILPNGAKDSTFPYQYYKQHYFDGFDFSDDRIARTPVFHSKMETYITKLTMQIPDSITHSADFLIAKTLQSKEISKWCIYWITNHYETSNYMGMDAVFVHMVKKYYTNKEATPWVDDALRYKITERANTLGNTLLGVKAKNLILPDSSMTYRSLYEISADYTIVVFWDPHCGRCKEEIPKLLTAYKELNGVVKTGRKKVEIYALGSTTDYAAWKSYIKDNKLPWINVHDPKHESNYHRLYDINSTPVIYLLNKDKKIAAKRLTVEQIKEFIEKGIE